MKKMLVFAVAVIMLFTVCTALYCSAETLDESAPEEPTWGAYGFVEVTFEANVEYKDIYKALSAVSKTLYPEEDADAVWDRIINIGGRLAALRVAPEDVSAAAEMIDGKETVASYRSLYSDDANPFAVSVDQRGDVNADGDINAADYAMVKRSVLGNLKLTEGQRKRADADANGDVNTTDYAMLKRHVLKTYFIAPIC